MSPEEIATLVGERSTVELISLLELIETELRGRGDSRGRRGMAASLSLELIHAAHLLLAQEVFGADGVATSCRKI